MRALVFDVFGTLVDWRSGVTEAFRASAVDGDPAELADAWRARYRPIYAIGEDPGVVMDEMGHTDPGLALAVYRKEMRRDEGEKARLRALVEGAELGTYRDSEREKAGPGWRARRASSRIAWYSSGFRNRSVGQGDITRLRRSPGGGSG